MAVRGEEREAGDPVKANRGPSAGPANRRALIDAAREVFATEGYNAPLNAVAKRAGVGQGSLYRHFPDRTALAVAVFDENIAALEDAAAAEAGTVATLMDRIVQQALVSTAFIDMVNAAYDDPRVEHIGTRVMAIVSGLLERDQAAGRVGRHVEPADVFIAISMLGDLLARTPERLRADAARRSVALFSAAFEPRERPPA